MRSMTILRSCIVIGFVLILIVCLPQGHTYPTKPIKMIVPMAPGGPLDTISRAVTEAAKPYFPKPIVVINKPGGGGAIGATEVIQAAPDGYTLGIFPESVMVLVPQWQKVPFKGPEDVEPILGPIIVPTMFIVRSDSPWTSMKEAVEYAKANPGKLTVGVAGGSENYLIIENVNHVSRVNMSPVPFEGGGPVVRALLGGHVSSAIAAGPPTIGHLRAGKIRYLAVTTPERIKWVPDVPTLKELGLAPAVFSRGINFFFVAPKGVPKDVLNFIRDNLNKSYQSKSTQKILDDNFLVPTSITPEEMSQQLKDNFSAVTEFLKKVEIRR